MTQVAQHLNELNVRNTLNLTQQQIDQIEANTIASTRDPEDTLKWLAEQYTKMYEHVTELSDDYSEPNYQLVANFLTDAPEWNEQLVEYFTRLATLQGEL